MSEQRETIGFAELMILPNAKASGGMEVVLRRSPDKVSSECVGNPLELRRAAAMLLRAADARESPGYESGIKTLVFRCDGLDACAIEAAIQVRKNFAFPILPGFDGDEDAATLAEACRAFIDEYGNGGEYQAAIKAAGLDEEDAEAAPCGQ